MLLPLPFNLHLGHGLSRCLLELWLPALKRIPAAASRADSEEVAVVRRFWPLPLCLGEANSWIT